MKAIWLLLVLVTPTRGFLPRLVRITVQQQASRPSTALQITDDTTLHTTALQRMRRRKVRLLQRRKATKTAYLLALWYLLSVGYNLASKSALNLAPELAWTTAAVQMAGGLAYALPLWWTGRRPRPHLSTTDLRHLVPIAALHALVHIGGVVSMGAGAVSFTYIVKASEPAVSAALLAATGTLLPLRVYATLLPIMVGVSLVSVSELAFSWRSFSYAMLSNLASAMRAMVAKRTLDRRWGEHLTAANLYAVLTVLATLLLVPTSALIEGRVWNGAFQRLSAANLLFLWIAHTVTAAACYYLYNEVAFLALDNLSTVSHAIANTVKRVFIIATSIVVFGNPMTAPGLVGSILALSGVWWYAMEQDRAADVKKEAAGKE